MPNLYPIRVKRFNDQITSTTGAVEKGGWAKENLKKKKRMPGTTSSVDSVE